MTNDELADNVKLVLIYRAARNVKRIDSETLRWRSKQGFQVTLTWWIGRGPADVIELKMVKRISDSPARTANEVGSVNAILDAEIAQRFNLGDILDSMLSLADVAWLHEKRIRIEID